MRESLLLSLIVTGCTVGAAGRGEITYGEGVFRAGVDVEGNFGSTAFADEAKLTDETLRQAPAYVFLMFVGVGLQRHPSLVAGIDFMTLHEGHVGVTGGLHVSIDAHSCSRVVAGLGPTGVLATTHADLAADSFGPNPRVTRLYDSLQAIAGVYTCDGNHPEVGLAYTAGVTDRLLAPGP